MIYLIPIHDIVDPLPICWALYPLYIEPPFTHGVSDPVYILTPLSMIYQTPLPIVYPWYIEPPAYGISVYILSPLLMVYQPHV